MYVLLRKFQINKIWGKKGGAGTVREAVLITLFGLCA